MLIRIGKVTNVYPSEGKVKVLYEDEQNTSLPLSMLTMNGEYSMPAVGERVVTMHMENGSSKGFVLGTYYGGSKKPAASSGYRKELGDGAYVSFQNGGYLVHAPNITLSCSAGTITVAEIINRLASFESSVSALERRVSNLESRL